MSNKFPRLHNAMWPGVLGKGATGTEPYVSLDHMLGMTKRAYVDGRRFDGVDLILSHPHGNLDMSDADVKRIADKIADEGLAVGSLVCPVSPGMTGGSSMGGPQQRAKFVLAVEKACRIAAAFNRHGVRKYGIIKIDSADSTAHYFEDPTVHTERIVSTFREAGIVAAAHGERLAVEGDVSRAGMQTWRTMLDLLEQVDMPGAVGFQADLAHSYLYLIGAHDPEGSPLNEGYSTTEFDDAYTTMTDALRPWTIDLQVSQTDGTESGTGSYDRTARHCLVDDPKGKLDLVKAAGFWLKEATDRNIHHICWDGSLWPNGTLENPQIWNTVLETMLRIREESGWNL